MHFSINFISICKYLTQGCVDPCKARYPSPLDKSGGSYNNLSPHLLSDPSVLLDHQGYQSWLSYAESVMAAACVLGLVCLLRQLTDLIILCQYTQYLGRTS